MSKQQGSYNTYIGARYVPIFGGQWDNTKTYEPLVIVEYQGNSYTSKTYVPIGVDINNIDYWALTGNYNAQVEAYRQEVLALRNQVNAFQTGLDALNKESPNYAWINVLHIPFDGIESLKGDGVTNDAPSLNALIEYLKANNIFARIYFPRSVYLLNSPITIDTNHLYFEGEEKGGTEFRCNVSNVTMFNISNTRFIKFENIAFWMRNIDETFVNTFVSIQSSNQIEFSYCMMYDAKFPLIINNGAGTHLFELTISTNNATYADAIGIQMTGLNNSTRFTNVIINQKGCTGNTRCLFVSEKIQDLFINHLETAGGAIAVEITSDTSKPYVNIRLVNCVFDEPTQRGLYIHDISNTLSSIVVQNVIIGMMNNGGINVRLEKCNNILLENINMYNTHSLTTLTGLSANANNNCRLRGGVITDCSVPVNIFGTSVGMVVEGVQIRNINVACNPGIGLQQCYNGSILNNTIMGKITIPVNIAATSHYSVFSGNNVNADAITSNKINDTTIAQSANNLYYQGI